MPYVGRRRPPRRPRTPPTRCTPARSPTPTRPPQPGYYKVGLDSGAGAELTATPAPAPAGSPSPPTSRPACCSARPTPRSAARDATVHIDPATRTVTGSVTAATSAARRAPTTARRYYTLHFTAHFDKPFAERRHLEGRDADAGRHHGRAAARGYGPAAGRSRARAPAAYVTFAPGTDPRRRQGRHLLRQPRERRGQPRGREPAAPHASPRSRRRPRTTRGSRDSAQIGIGGGTDDQRTTFYTALYHVAAATRRHQRRQRPVHGRRRQAAPARPRARRRSTAPSPAGTSTARRCSCWRCSTRRSGSDIAQSLFNHATQRGGEWDRWLLEHGKTSVMSGDPSAAALAGIYAFGGARLRRQGRAAARWSRPRPCRPRTTSAAPAATSSASASGPSLDKYLELGYVPADDCHCWGGAAETLEDAAADFGLSELAGQAGDRANAAGRSSSASGSWKNVFDPTPPRRAATSGTATPTAPGPDLHPGHRQRLRRGHQRAVHLDGLLTTSAGLFAAMGGNETGDQAAGRLLPQRRRHASTSRPATPRGTT